MVENKCVSHKHRKVLKWENNEDHKHLLIYEFISWFRYKNSKKNEPKNQPLEDWWAFEFQRNKLLVRYIQGESEILLHEVLSAFEPHWEKQPDAEGLQKG